MKKSFTIILFFSALSLSAQTSVLDTITLESIRIDARRIQSDNNVGARTTSISVSVLESNHTQSIADLLSENSLVYIKSMGQGALATSSFRGTSSNHTQVNWNGININSPMQGNFDFSQVPTFFIDEVTLFHGAGYLKGGTGALGGSINLNNGYRYIARPEFKVLSEYGTNQTFTEGVSASFSVGDLTSSTRVYYQQSENNFRYLNNVLSKDEFYERRSNAQYEQLGVMQELYYDLGKGNMLSASAWYQGDDRNLPPPIMVYRTSRENQTTNTLRSYIGFNRKSAKHSFGVTAAFLYDRMCYSRVFDISLGDLYTKNRSFSYVTKANYNYEHSSKLTLGAAINYQHDKVLSDNYTDSKSCRDGYSAQISAKYTPVNWFTLDAQTMADGKNGDFAPTYSIGANVDIIDNLLAAKISNAYNCRFPTLNDLYWTPGGNRNLKPEHGFSYDATLSYTPRVGRVNFRFDATYYRMDIDNWIMWVPTGNGYVWEPRNFSRVLSQGTEITAEANLKIGESYNRLIFNYGYSPSIDKSDRRDATRDRQLPYIPKNKWNARYMFNINGLNFSYSAAFTDVRYTSADESYSTTAYIIHDCEAGYRFKIGGVGIKTSVRVNNIWNVYYESTQYYPMPLRSVFGSILITF